MDLTIDELDILIEAMTAWESRGAAGEMMSSLVGHMLAKTDEQKEELQEQAAKEKEQKEIEKRKEKETSILIKAKLIHMKDTATAKAAADFMTG